MKHNRYFVINYMCQDKDKNLMLGDTDIKTDKEYPARKKFVEYLAKQDMTNIVIINIIELSEQDYKDFYS